LKGARHILKYIPLLLAGAVFVSRPALSSADKLIRSVKYPDGARAASRPEPAGDSITKRNNLVALLRTRAQLARTAGDPEALLKALDTLNRLEGATRKESLERITAAIAARKLKAAREIIASLTGGRLAPLEAKALLGACADHAGDAKEAERLWRECLAITGGSEFLNYKAADIVGAVGGSSAGTRFFFAQIYNNPPHGTRYDISALAEMVLYWHNRESYGKALPLNEKLRAVQGRGNPLRSLSYGDKDATLRKLAEAIGAKDLDGLLTMAITNPEKEEIALVAGRMLREAGREKDAGRVVAGTAKLLKAKIDANPRHASTHNSLAWLYARTGFNLDKALAHAQRAVALAPHTSAYLDTLGEVLFVSGRTREAERTELRAIFTARSQSRTFFFEQLKRFRRAHNK